MKNICQYKKIEENRCCDIKIICQHQAKMNADVKMLCQDQKKWKIKHKIEATDVKNTRQRSKKIFSKWLKLFIADVKLLCQWYRKMKNSAQKLKFHWLTYKFYVNTEGFFRILACTDRKKKVSKVNLLQWHKKLMSALGKSQRL